MATLVVLVGVMLTMASALRLGFLANFISEPVLIGFKAGIAVVIVVDQIPKLLGIHFTKGAFFHNIAAIAEGIPGASVPTDRRERADGSAHSSRSGISCRACRRR